LILFSKDAVLGCVLVADTVKPEAAEFVSELEKRGKDVVMLTGDNEITAAAIASKAGIETFKAGVFPHEKEEYIRALIQNGKTPVMVGDGINDSAALTSATLGIAMGSGTDIAIESADCVLLRDSLGDIITLFNVSRFALRIIKQNLFWALFYNCLCIPLAAGVLVPVGISFSPMFASAAMSLSSLFVVTNALRIMKK
jgi:P-type E1-E2 ATPase